ncbi:hypothetical protein MJO29_008061, partial [Puccinia striiformis f. sp. tritici]
QTTINNQTIPPNQIPSAGLKELPTWFERCEMEDLIESISNLVNFTISSLTVYRFCITLVTIGPKCTCNSFYSNLRYAQVATTNNQQSMMMITSNKKIDQEMAEEGGRRMEAGIKQIGRDD